MIVTRARAAKLVRAREGECAASEESCLFPPFARQPLERLEQAALDAVAEMVGLHTVPATVDAVVEQQARADFFPFVRAWCAPLLESDARLLATACALAGVQHNQVDAALQWRDAVTSFAALVRPALVAAMGTFELLGAAATHGNATFEAALLGLDRGELRSRAAVVAHLGNAMAGAVFGRIVLAAETELVLLEDAIARRVPLRVWQLQRHKHALDSLSAQVDLTVLENDERETQELVVYCQHKVRGLASGVGLRPVASELVAPAKRRKKKTKEQRVEQKAPKERSAEKVDEPEQHMKPHEEEERNEDEEELVVEEEVEDEPDWLRQVRSDLVNARDSTTTVLDLLANRDEQGSLHFNVNAVEPSAVMATADAGQSLVADVPTFRELLRNDDNTGAHLDSLGRLSHWWVIVKRAYAFHGLFLHLAEKKARRAKRVSLEKQWLALVKGVRGSEYSFKQRPARRVSGTVPGLLMADALWDAGAVEADIRWWRLLYGRVERSHERRGQAILGLLRAYSRSIRRAAARGRVGWR